MKRQLLSVAAAVATAVVAVALVLAQPSLDRTGSTRASPATDGHEIPSSTFAESTAPPTRSASSASAASSASPAEPPPSRGGSDSCVSIDIIHDGPAPTLENELLLASAVVVATVQAVGEARWNTVNGSRPRAPEQATMPLYRPVTVSIDEAVTGEALLPAGSVELMLRGGTIGCDRVYVNGTPESLEVGDRYVFTLDQGVQSLADGSYPLFVDQSWPVDAADQVRTPLDGTVSVAELLDTAGEVELPTLAP